MFNGKKFTDNDFEDFRRYDEYQRAKDEAIVKGASNFLYRIIIYGFILFATVPMIGTLLDVYTSLDKFLILIISFISGFSVFKIKYVKNYPLKSLLIIIFIDFLIILAF